MQPPTPRPTEIGTSISTQHATGHVEIRDRGGGPAFYAKFKLPDGTQPRRRLGRHASAWRSTRAALHAIGLSIVIELSATVLAAGAWLAAILSR